MELQVLGPIRVVSAGEPAYIRPGKPRLVLAILAAQADRAVSTGSLTRLVWGDAAPASARRNLQQHIHHLRRTLGAERIVGSGGEYAYIADDGFDAGRFRSLATSADNAIRAGDLPYANRLLRSAMDLWRGPAYVEFADCAPVADEASRLDQLRLAVQEQWAATELALGRYGEAIEVMSDLVREHPGRESLCAHLMLALYRGGRQSEALRVYRDTYRHLVDEIGVTPGPELRTLQHQILTCDPVLTPPSGAPDRHATPTPRMLPPAPEALFGRERELARIVTVLTAEASRTRSTVVALHGPGGVGKSALAAVAGHTCADEYPDGQLYADLQGATPNLEPLRAEQALGQFLRALGVPPERVPTFEGEAAAMFRSQLAGRRVLIVADNAAALEQVQPIIPAESRCAVIVTSRAAMSGLDAIQVPVMPLPPAAAHGMIRHIVGAQRADRHEADVAAVAQRCGRLPLAIRIAAGRLLSRPDWSVADLATRLADRHTALRELTAGDKRLRASFDVTWQELERGDDADALAARIVVLLGALSVPDIEPGLTSAVLDAGTGITQAALDRLVELHLLEVSEQRYRAHDVCRIFATELAAARIGSDTGHLARSLRWYYAGAHQAARLTGRPVDPACPVPDGDSAAPALDDADLAGPWLDAERDNLVALIRQALEAPAPLPERATHLVMALYPALLMRSHGHEWELLCRAVLDASTVHDSLYVGRIGVMLAMLYRMQGRLDEALTHLDHASKLLRSIDDHRGESFALDILGQVHVARGEPEHAVQYFERALRMRRADGDQLREAATLSNAAEAYFRTGQGEVALHMLRKSLTLRHRTNDVVGEALTNENLAEVLLSLREPHAALRHAEAAVACARHCGGRDIERRTLTLQARVLLTLGQHELATTTSVTALALAGSARPTNPGDLRELADAFRAAGLPEPATAIEAFLRQSTSGWGARSGSGA